ncbi:MAG: nitroreductase family protein [Spirochaetota bacterium]
MLPSPYPVDFSERSEFIADETFVQRWSPRAFDGNALSQDTLDTIFDAARFSPSAFNAQPWRILCSKADRSDFDRFLALLIETNQTWARTASALGFMVARKNFEHNNKENKWARYDCGFAWAAMTFQANRLGLYTHGMAGIKAEEVYREFGLDAEVYDVIAGFALGKLSNPEQLPAHFRSKEKPSARKTLPEIYFPGGTLQ